MNILHLITSLKVGGAESALVNYLSKVVGKDGNIHSVAYFHHGPNVKKIEDLGINVYKISGFFFTYDLFVFFRLKSIVKLVRPDVIHSSLWSSNIIARVISKISKIPVICDLHGNSLDEGSLRNWFDRITVNYCAKIVAVSDSVKDSYSKNIIGIYKCGGEQSNVCSKLIIIKNGIDVQSLRDKAFKEPLVRKDYRLSEDDFVVGAVGRLESIKSYDVLIKAFARAVSFLGDGVKLGSNFRAKLVIVGGGSQMKVLQALVKSLKLEEYVVFTGFRPDAYKFYPMFDCFALSSQSEGLSIALLEAMAFALPIISTNFDISKHDVITPGINGFLVYPNDIDSYAAVIGKLFRDYQEGQLLIKSIGKQNFKLVCTEFCIDEVVRRYQELYIEVATQGDFSKKL